MYLPTPNVKKHKNINETSLDMLNIKHCNRMRIVNNNKSN